jgi:hypothetical protein
MSFEPLIQPGQQAIPSPLKANQGTGVLRGGDSPEKSVIANIARARTTQILITNLTLLDSHSAQTQEPVPHIGEDSEEDDSDNGSDDDGRDYNDDDDDENDDDGEGSGGDEELHMDSPAPPSTNNKGTVRTKVAVNLEDDTEDAENAENVAPSNINEPIETNLDIGTAVFITGEHTVDKEAYIGFQGTVQSICPHPDNRRYGVSIKLNGSKIVKLFDFSAVKSLEDFRKPEKTTPAKPAKAPSIAKPAVKQIAAKQTAVKQIAAKQTAVKQTAVKQPAAKQPVAKQLVGKQPVGRPAAAKPAVAKPVAKPAAQKKASAPTQAPIHKRKAAPAMSAPARNPKRVARESPPLIYHLVNLQGKRAKYNGRKVQILGSSTSSTNQFSYHVKFITEGGTPISMDVYKYQLEEGDGSAVVMENEESEEEEEDEEEEEEEEEDEDEKAAAITKLMTVNASLKTMCSKKDAEISSLKAKLKKMKQAALEMSNM